MPTNPTSAVRSLPRTFIATPRAAKLAAAVSLCLECLRAVDREEEDEADAHRATYLAARNEILSLLGVDELEVVRDSRGVASALRAYGLTLSA